MAERKTERNERSLLDELVQLITAWLLARLKKEVTEVEYSDDGSLGYRLKLAEKYKERAEQELARNKTDEARENFEKAGGILRNLLAEVEIFREERDKAEYAGGVREAVTTLDVSMMPNDARKERSSKLEGAYGRHNSEDERKKSVDGFKQKDRAGKEQQLEAVKRQRQGEHSAIARKPEEGGAPGLDQEFDARLKKLEGELIAREEGNEGMRGASGYLSTKGGTEYLQTKFASEWAEVLRLRNTDPKGAQQRLDKLRGDLEAHEHLLGSIDLDQQRQRISKMQERIDEKTKESSHTTMSTRYRRKLQAELEAQFRNGGMSAEDYILRMQNLDSAGRMPPELMAQHMRNLGMLHALREDAPESGRETRRRMMEAGMVPDFLEGAEEGEQVFSELIYNSPDRALNTLRSEAQKYGVLNAETMRAMAQDYMMKIVGSGEGTRDYLNTPEFIILGTLLKSEAALNLFGVTREQRDEIRYRLFDFLTMRDFGIGARSADWEQYFRMSQGTGGMDAFNNAAQMKLQYKIILRDDDGNERIETVGFNVSEMADLVNVEYFGMRALSRRMNVQSAGYQALAMYTIARNTEGWKDVYTADGALNFENFKVTGPDEEGCITVTNGISKVVIAGYESYERKQEGGFRQFDCGGLADQVNNLAATVGNMEKHVSMRLLMQDYFHDGDVNDKLAKYIDGRYWKKFGIPLWSELMDVLDPGRRDLVTETYAKAMQPLFKKMELQHGKKVSAKDIEDFMRYAMKNGNKWMMTSEMMLKNWDALMKERQVVGDGGVKTGRWDRLSEAEREKAEGLMERFIDKGNDVDWNYMIRHFLGIEEGEDVRKAVSVQLHMNMSEVPDWVGTKGENGFRTLVLVMNRSKMYDTESVWSDVHDDMGSRWYKSADMFIKEGVWIDDFDKHADYMMRQAKGFGARARYSTDPDWETLDELLKKSGNYDFYDRMRMDYKVVEMYGGLDRLFNRQRKTWAYRKNENNALIQIGVNEEGMPIFETVDVYNDSLGSRRGYKNIPVWLTRKRINELYRQGLITSPKTKDYLYRQYVEQYGGFAIRSGPLKHAWAFDPFFWVKDHGRLYHLKGKRRWGVGPMIRAWREWLTKWDQKQWAGDVAGAWSELLGKELKEAVS